MSRILFFDTETTGLILNENSSYFVVENFPRIVQLAYMLCTIDNKLLKAANIIIKPSDFIIPEASVKYHGINQEKALKLGTSIIPVLADFLCVAIEADYIIAHNLNFDYRILGAESVRAGFGKHFKEIFEHREKICTMETTIDLCKIVKEGTFKRPRLTELYQFLFKESFDNPHDAFEDVKACSKCFFELKNQGFYKVESYDLMFLGIA